jgi:excisionase family DNA binding protein
MSNQQSPWLEQLREEYPPILKYDEVAEILRISPKTVYDILDQHPELCVNPTSNRYRIKREALLKFLANGGAQKNSGNDNQNQAA